MAVGTRGAAGRALERCSVAAAVRRKVHGAHASDRRLAAPGFVAPLRPDTCLTLVAVLLAGARLAARRRRPRLLLFETARKLGRVAPAARAALATLADRALVAVVFGPMLTRGDDVLIGAHGAAAAGRAAFRRSRWQSGGSGGWSRLGRNFGVAALRRRACEAQAADDDTKRAHGSKYRDQRSRRKRCASMRSAAARASSSLARANLSTLPSLKSSAR